MPLPPAKPSQPPPAPTGRQADGEQDTEGTGKRLVVALRWLAWVGKTDRSSSNRLHHHQQPRSPPTPPPLRLAAFAALYSRPPPRVPHPAWQRAWQGAYCACQRRGQPPPTQLALTSLLFSTSQPPHSSPSHHTPQGATTLDTVLGLFADRVDRTKGRTPRPT